MQTESQATQFPQKKWRDQGVGGSIPALVDVSLSKTLNPELLPVAALRCVTVTGL